jgi:DNA-binding Lrp family transcriptional regulator
MNKKDMQILSYLRMNARIPLTKMSKEVQIPVSTIFDRLRVHEKDIIIKHTSLLNYSALGYNTRANIAFKVNRDDKESLKNFLIKHENINSISRINNGYDFMVEGIFQQIKDMEDFIDMLEQKFNIEDKKSFFIIEDIKKECFMSDVNLINHII